VGDGIIHVTVRDETADSYTVNEIGFFTDAGVLFAVYAMLGDPIVIKSASSALLLAIDAAFVDVDATSITSGDTNFSNPPATGTTPGIVRFQQHLMETSPFVAMRHGAFGLGGLLEIDDADSAVLGGFYSLPASLGTVNAPLADTSGVLYVANGGDGSDYVHQMWCQAQGHEQGRMYVRHYNAAQGWSDWIEMGGANAITLDGPLLIYPGTSNTYLITNYDAFSTYTATCSAGATAALADDTLTIDVDLETAPGDLFVTLTRNGMETLYQIEVGPVGIAQPVIEYPSNGATDLVETLTIYSSAFSTYPPEFDSHISTDWEIATDAGFTAIAYQSLADETNLVELSVPPDTLDYLTTHYVRVRYRGVQLVSDWSVPVAFTTRKIPLPTAEVAKIFASDGFTDDFFGMSVTMNQNGTVAVVGSPNDDDDGDRSGSAYVYNYVGGSWIQVAKLTASDAATLDRFGYTADINAAGTVCVIGAMYNSDAGTYSGSAYIFAESGGSWSQIAKLTANDAASTDYFGRSVSINAAGTRVLVGADLDDDGGSDSGSVYVFDESGGSWSQVAKLTAGDAGAGDKFGASAGLNGVGDIAIIGAPANTDAGTASGSAYIFAESGGSWSQAAKLTASDAAAGDNFGCAVAIDGDGDTVIIGAYGNDDAGSDSGSAYIFAGSGGSWSQVVKLTADDAAAGDDFGWSVSIDEAGAVALVGASAGGAYIFNSPGGIFSQLAKLTASDGTSALGEGVAISGDGTTCIVADERATGTRTYTGAAYIFA